MSDDTARAGAVVLAETGEDRYVTRARPRLRDDEPRDYAPAQRRGDRRLEVAMRRALGIVIVLSVLWSGEADARTRCGDDPNDAAAVAAAESAIVLQCECCAPHHGYAACVSGLLRAARRAATLPSRCAMKVRRDVGHACPRVRPASACVPCNDDGDCAPGAFCDCRAQTCAKTAGVCAIRPAVCPDVVAPVCGCDGTTYANDCLRQHAGACKLHKGACVATGGCFDTIAGTCTGTACSPADGCARPNEFCSPACGSPPPTGTCFDMLARRCTQEACGPDHACLPNEICAATCPPPPPAGRCFVTVDDACSDVPCGPDAPCRNPNEFCDPHCLAPACGSDADCDDGNGCSVDRCDGGTCTHVCVCLGPAGTASCCPGPAAFCVKPCAMSNDGACGGACVDGGVCAAVDGGCACVGAAPSPTPTPILDPTPHFATPTFTPIADPTPLPPGTIANAGGSCRWTLDCPILGFGDGGNLWPYAPNAPSGTFSGWIQWSLGPYPTAPVTTCSPFTGTSTYPSWPPRMQGTTYSFTLEGSCDGVDADGKAYTIATTQNLQTFYSRGGGGKGGGGAGWKVRDTGGTTTIDHR